LSIQDRFGITVTPADPQQLKTKGWREGRPAFGAGDPHITLRLRDGGNQRLDRPSAGALIEGIAKREGSLDQARPAAGHRAQTEPPRAIRGPPAAKVRTCPTGLVAFRRRAGNAVTAMASHCSGDGTLRPIASATGRPQAPLCRPVPAGTSHQSLLDAVAVRNHAAQENHRRPRHPGQGSTEGPNELHDSANSEASPPLTQVTPAPPRPGMSSSAPKQSSAVRSRNSLHRTSRPLLPGVVSPGVEVSRLHLTGTLHGGHRWGSARAKQIVPPASARLFADARSAAPASGTTQPRQALRRLRPVPQRLCHSTSTASRRGPGK